MNALVATVLTACGIETRTHYENSFQNYQLQQCLPLAVLKLSIATSIIAWWMRCNSAYRLRYWNRIPLTGSEETLTWGCNSAYRLRYWNSPPLYVLTKNSSTSVATALTVCSMRRRVRGSRGAKRRWGPHISSPWLKGRENKGDEVTALTVYGIETAQFWIH